SRSSMVRAGENRMMKYAMTAALVLGVAGMTTGCVTAKRAVPMAAHRSGCEADKIKVVNQEGRNAVLDVCGTHEDWHFHPFNGYSYVGPSAEQPEKPPVDGDGDGVNDGVDACPSKAGVATADPTTNGCPPPPDTDGDGVADPDDACLEVAGVKSDDAKTNGCPPDKDGDGVADASDACADVAGVKSDDAKANGCPPDKDGDGIVDASDACPDKAGTASDDPAKSGCPEEAAEGEGDAEGDAKDAAKKEPPKPDAAKPDAAAKKSE
ncbi:MAG: thrombospondin type 3 repeat-containing protein, partial [Polyangiaceae bacterium]